MTTTKEARMELRRDEPDTDRKMMEEVPQEPIAADPIEDDETDDEADDEDPEAAGAGQPVELEDERR
jgi:hypothetical protein